MVRKTNIPQTQKNKSQISLNSIISKYIDVGATYGLNIISVLGK
jgi:hypothetical protein